MSYQEETERLLAEIAQFLENEQVIFGPFQFSKTIEGEHSASLDESQAVTLPPRESSTPDKVPGSGPSTNKEQHSRSDNQSIVQPERSDKNSLQDLLDACKNLEELKSLCEKADELRTDLKGTNLVFGVGDPNADLMLIGEAPGEQEDIEGEPFVGAAGQLLNKILAAIYFKREEVYIANILKHRPPGNRNPNPKERLRSLPYLLRQIDLVQPKLILCLGKVSGTTLLDKEGSLKNLRGEFYPFRNTLLTVTYHPAALLRNPQWKRPVWEDVQKVKKKVAELSDGE